VFDYNPASDTFAPNATGVVNLRVRVPYDSGEERLHFHGVWDAVNGEGRKHFHWAKSGEYLTQIPRVGIWENAGVTC
jgi:hypothetical protein